MSSAINEYLNTPFRATERANSRQVENNTGGYVYKADDEQRLTRFLVLGTDGGSYYTGQRDMTKQNVDFILDFIKRDEMAVIEIVTDVSVNARAPKSSTALFVLALVFVHGKNKAAATEALLQVARTATHLFEFTSYLKAMGGLGRAKRKALAKWMTNKSPEALAAQAVKYRSRHGYTLRDIMRLSHPEGISPVVGEYILKGAVGEDAPEILKGFIEAQKVTTGAQAVKVLERFPRLTWEAFPTDVHNSPEFWKALFYNGMGATALLRNVTRFAKLGLFDDVKFAGDVAKALSDPEAIKKGRLHPVQYLNAHGIYAKGRSANSYGYYLNNSGTSWKVNSKVAGALEKGFYAAFGNVTPADKRTMVSLDVSGSMTWAAPAGLVGLNCMEAAVAMAMVTIRTEPYVEVNAFSHGLMEVNISDTSSLNSAIKSLDNLSFSSTNIAAPIEKALRERQVIDHFIIYTDSEVNTGRNVSGVLNEYRRKVNPEARLTVVGMTANEFTVGDPDDSLTLAVVGFDSAAPSVISEFASQSI